MQMLRNERNGGPCHRRAGTGPRAAEQVIEHTHLAFIERDCDRFH